MYIIIMKKYKEIKDFLNEHEELWYKIDEHGENKLPLMDVDMEIDKKTKVCKLFFTGDSDYFPGIHIMEKNIALDKCPVYVFDLQSDDPPELIGNFRNYMTIILKNYIKETDDQDAINVLNQLKSFSKIMIDVKAYTKN
jgi:hypothetical protein